MELSKATTKRLMLLIAFAAALFTFPQWAGMLGKIWRFSVGVLSPFLLGAALAFILNVPMRFFEKKLFPADRVIRSGKRKSYRVPPKLARIVSLLLTLIAAVLIILVLILIVAPQLGDTIESLSITIQAAIPGIIDQAERLFANNPDVISWLNSLTFDWDGIITSVVDFLKKGAGDVLNSTISAAKNVVSALTNFFIGLVFSIYLLLQKEKLALQCRKALYALLREKTARHVIGICSLSQRIFSSFITGQGLEAVILGFMFFIAMTILRMPYALLVGCLIAVTALIPIVGAFIGCAVGAFLLLINSPMQALIFVIMFLILQQVEGNLIYPHVVGNSVGLPSIWVLAAVSIGGSLMGVTGMLLFIPLVSVVYTLFREYVYKRLKEKGLKVT